MPDSPLLVLGISLTPWPHPGLIQASASGGASGLQREHRLQAGQAGVWREATGKRRAGRGVRFPKRQVEGARRRE